MLMITSRLHGMIDYLVGFGLIATPWLFGFIDFADFPAATWMPIIIGSTIIAISLFTNYEFSLIKFISMRTHLVIDFIAGAFLAVSPWLLNFADYVYAPHLIVGVVQMLIVTMTITVPFRPRQRMVESTI